MTLSSNSGLTYAGAMTESSPPEAVVGATAPMSADGADGADEILAEAKRQAQELIAAAERDAEAIRADGRRREEELLNALGDHIRDMSQAYIDATRAAREAVLQLADVTRRQIVEAEPPTGRLSPPE